MRTVNLHFAKTHLSRLVDEVLAGGDVVIGRAGSALVRLVPVEAPKGNRRFDIDKGKIRIADDFDAPLEDFEEAFYGPTNPA